MKKIFFSIIMMTLSSCAILHSNPNRKEKLLNQVLILKPFTTDYCSGWPNGEFTNTKQWVNCCFSHDISYWIGGTKNERLIADKKLKSCVSNSSDSINAFFMYIGVRLGGIPGSASYAWGYGWTKNREYLDLNQKEIATAKELLLNSEFNKSENKKNVINAFIEQVLNKKIETNN